MTDHALGLWGFIVGVAALLATFGVAYIVYYFDRRNKLRAIRRELIVVLSDMIESWKSAIEVSVQILQSWRNWPTDRTKVVLPPDGIETLRQHLWMQVSSEISKIKAFNIEQPFRNLSTKLTKNATTLRISDEGLRERLSELDQKMNVILGNAYNVQAWSTGETKNGFLAELEGIRARIEQLIQYGGK
jgi:hypothetical protein